MSAVKAAAAGGPNAVRAVIFDFNGTLFFDNDKHVKAWGRISQELRGMPVSQDELLTKMNGVPNKEIIRYLTDGRATPEQQERYSQLKERYYREFCAQDKANFHLVEGATELFDELTRCGIPFTIASASIEPNIDFFIRSFGLDRWMSKDHIVFDDGSYQSKVAMYKRAAQLLGQPMASTLVFEDSASGLASAVEAGCQRVVLVDTTGLRETCDRTYVAQCITNFNEFDRALLGRDETEKGE